MEKTKDISKRFLTRILNGVVMAAAVAVMFGCLTLQANAATGKITGGSVNIRKEASTNSEAVGSASRGDSFTIQSEVTGADGHVWYKISFDGSKVGYVRSDLMEKSAGNDSGSTITPSTSNAEVTKIQPITAKITGNQVRVRPDASTNGSVVTTVARDAIVNIDGMAEGNDNKTWYRISVGNITGFIREDFLQLAGEVIPVTEEEVPDVPPVDEPLVNDPEPIVTIKDYETVEADGTWYLIDNVQSHKFVIADIFDAAKTNAELYEQAKKTVNTQKIFIIILVILIVAGATGATILIFKMKDMMDDAYFEEVERESFAKRQNKQQNVMHTVGRESVQKKPVVNSQKRPGSQAQPMNGQVKQMPKQQSSGGQVKPNMKVQTAGTQAKQPVKQGQAAVQQKVQSGTQVKSPIQNSDIQKQQVKSQEMVSQVKKASDLQHQQRAASVKPSNTKPNQEWKTKNFMTDDEDDFEFEFLNWDGDEEL